jgi:hypothetical protein
MGGGGGGGLPTFSYKHIKFLDGRDVLQDTAPTHPVWKLTVGSDYAHDDMAQRATYPNGVPYVYVSGRTMKFDVTFEYSNPTPNTIEIYVRGEGPAGFTVGGAWAKLLPTGGRTVTVTFKGLTLDKPFEPDKVDYYNPFAIRWFWAEVAWLAQPPEPGDPSWKSAGESRGIIYVLHKAPNATLYHTVVNLGSSAAKGKKAASDITEAIWSKFATLRLQRADDGEVLKYYWNYSSSSFFTETKKLLENADGNCNAWSRLFADVLKAQGLFSSVSIVRLVANPMLYGGFLVNRWSFIAADSFGDYPFSHTLTGPYNPDDLRRSFMEAETGPGGEPRGHKLDPGSGVKDEEGIPGQGNPNPASVFGKHMVVQLGGEWFDPSYGMRYKDEPGKPLTQQFDDAAIAGYITYYVKVGPLETAKARPNPPGNQIIVGGTDTY